MKIPFLLTATIDPNNCSHVARTSIDDRKADYHNAMRRWLEETNFDFVFVENSGYDLDFLKRDYGNSGRVEFISYDGNNYERSLGKGYGELQIVRKALTDSTKIGECEYFAKSTGRYFFPGMQSFVESHKFEDYDYVGIYDGVVCNLVTTGFYCVKKTFIENFISDLPKRWPFVENPVNDGVGFYIEELFTQLALSTERRLFVDKIGAVGISGTFNKPIDWM